MAVVPAGENLEPTPAALPDARGDAALTSNEILHAVHDLVPTLSTHFATDEMLFAAAKAEFPAGKELQLAVSRELLTSEDRPATVAEFPDAVSWFPDAHVTFPAAVRELQDAQPEVQDAATELQC